MAAIYNRCRLGYYRQSEEMPLPGGGKLTDPTTNWNTLGYTASLIDRKQVIPLHIVTGRRVLRNPTKLQQMERMVWLSSTDCYDEGSWNDFTCYTGNQHGSFSSR